MENKEIIEQFYTAFQNLDSKTMNSFLADDVEFEDPAFGKLKGEDVKYMWQFLTENAKEFKMKFSDISVKENNGKANWEAHYVFSSTGRKVHNIIEASFVFKNGKVIKHQDHFDIKSWVKQALGPMIGLIGGSSFIKKSVRKQTKSLLVKYKSKNKLK